MKTLDLDRAIEAKNPKLARLMPRFVKRYLNRILHLDELNKLLDDNKGSTGIEFTRASIDHFGISYVIEGEENLSCAERGLYVSNHPLGGLDGIVLLHIIALKHGEVKSLINDFLMWVEPIQDMFIPVNKTGSSREYHLAITEAYQSDLPLMVFPAGLCSRKQSFGVFDIEWNKSFVKKARQFGRPIIPIYVEGENSRFFYNLAWVRRKLGIKFNIEMLYLSDEMVKQRGKTLKIYTAPPISPDMLDTSVDDWEWARRIRQLVYDMKVQKCVLTFNPERESTLPMSYYG